MKGRPVTSSDVKVGDKVVYNEDGKRFNQEHYSTMTFDEVVYGVVINFTNSILVVLDLYNYKGFKIKSHWNVYFKHLDYYEG